MAEKTSAKEFRRRRVALGYCNKCAVRPSVDGETRCDECIKYLAEWREKNKAQRCEYNRKYFALNPGVKVRYEKSHPDVVRMARRAHKANRRARESGAEVGTAGVKQIRQLMVSQKGLCIVCRVRLDKYHVDHIIPLALGGAHHKTNLQLLCPECNIQKGAKHPVDFMQSRGLLI